MIRVRTVSTRITFLKGSKNVNSVDNAIGFQVRKLSNVLKKRREKEDVVNGIELTMMQRWVIGYLAHNRDHDVYQKELESELNIGKSTLTELLHTMEKNDLVARRSVEEDARCKKIVLTQKSNEIDSKISRNIELTEEKMCENISQEDLDTFLRVIKSMINNLERSL